MADRDPLIQSIIGCAHTVAKELGFGFSDKVYGNALAFQMRKAKWKVAQEVALDIFYDGVCVGTSQADLIVERRVIVAVTIGDGIDAADIAQCRNDLKAACLVTGLIIGFGYSRIEARKVSVVSEEGDEEWVTDVIKVV